MINTIQTSNAFKQEHYDEEVTPLSHIEVANSELPPVVLSIVKVGQAVDQILSDFEDFLVESSLVVCRYYKTGKPYSYVKISVRSEEGVSNWMLENAGTFQDRKNDFAPYSQVRLSKLSDDGDIEFQIPSMTNHDGAIATLIEGMAQIVDNEWTFAKPISQY